MKQRSRVLSFAFLAAVAVYIAYVGAMNLVIDPLAAEFLAHKTNLTRELHLPVWLKVKDIHVVAACLALATGTLNFLVWNRAQRRRYHRWAGYVYIGSVAIVVLTSGYMAPYSTGGKAVSIAFNAMNIVWLVFTIGAYVHIMKRRVARHRSWMVRSFVFCFTNFWIHAIADTLRAAAGLSYELSYASGVYAAFAINLLLAEVIVRSQWFARADRSARPL